MKRKLKKFIDNNISFLVSIISMSLIIFMAIGYSALNTRLEVYSNSSIVDEKPWNPEVSFILAERIDNIFFYYIDIYNDSSFEYKNWQVKFYNCNYISYIDFFDAEKQDYGWLISNDDWDNKINPNESLSITLVFSVDNYQGKMSIEEYSRYFVENYIKVSGTTGSGKREGEIISNGNSSLTLKQGEKQITNYSISEDSEFVPKVPNEKRYILDIYNDTDQTISKIRMNMYFGDSKIIEISPCEIISNHITDSTIQFPFWLEISPHQNVSIYIIVETLDNGFVPELVIAGQ